MEIIPLTANGEGRRTVTLGDVVVAVVTKYSYSAACWMMDLIDVNDEYLAAGLMLVPDVDLLKPYPALTELIGSLQIYERNAGDYRSPDKLGTDVRLVWTR